MLVSLWMVGVGACSDSPGTGRGSDAASADAGGDVGLGDVGPDTSGDDVGTDTDDDTGPSCQDQCDQLGQAECTDDGVRECIRRDGCLAWGEPTACPTGASCSDGQCRQSCPNQACTVLGAKQCGDGGVQECVDADSDGCLEWGQTQACATGQSCSNGHCAVGCADECSAVDATECQANGVARCGDIDDDSCLEWDEPTDCGDQFCVDGRCQTTCTDECSGSGQRRCNADGYQTCSDSDDDGCLEWGTTVSCPAEQSCSSGFCADTCSDECTTAGAKQCSGDSVETCGDTDTDPCLEWGSAVPCEAGLVCSSGHCAQTCTDECTVDGATSCDPSGGVITCADDDSDGCLEWSDPITCTGAQVYSGGNCALDCTDECSTVDQRRCAPTTTTDYQVCDDHDTDGCLEWGSAQSCAGTQVCSNGNCAQTCTDECTVDGADECVDDGSRRTCGDTDADDCLEWGTTVYCGATESCQSGSCVANPAPDGLVISEVRYDGDGSDSDSFVEIHGPANTDLEGVSLVGVNGNGGGEYNEISLSGTVGADGLFVVAQPSAPAAVTDAADILDDDADYQNGPDSIELTFGSDVLDAVGYGSFGSSDTFAGEANAAVDAAAGQSLTRDADFSDTDDNAADFTVADSPTPGAPADDDDDDPPPTGSEPPTAAFTAVASSSTEVIVDANGSYDDQTPTSALEVRWDWDNDGAWDTNWSTDKTATHTYGTSSATIGLQVRDGDDQRASISHTVDLSTTLTTVSGTIDTDTTWSGRILMTNDVTVADGATLTITAGTQIMAVHIEDDTDDYGDVELTIEGSFVGQGTPTNPVLFTVYESNQRAAGTWEGILNDGDFDASNLIVEYAETGLNNISDDQSIANVEARNNVVGIIGRQQNLDLQDLKVHDNGVGLNVGCGDYCRRQSDDNVISATNITARRNDTGVVVEPYEGDSISLFGVTTTDNTIGLRVGSSPDSYISDPASISLTRSTVSNNDTYGIFVADAYRQSDYPQDDATVLRTFNITHTDIVQNTVGVAAYLDLIDGNFANNNLRQNNYAGLIVAAGTTVGGWAAPSQNNIDGNGAGAGITTIAANQDYVGTTQSTQQWTWSTPAGQEIMVAYATIDSQPHTVGINTDVNATDADGLFYQRSGWAISVDDGSGGSQYWPAYVPQYALSDTIFVELTSSYYTEPEVHLHDVVVWDPTAASRDVAAFGDIDLTDNYLGDPATAADRVFIARDATVDASSTLSSEVSGAGR